MTRDRDFKNKVRARMARTGERYAAARASLAGKRTEIQASTGPLWRQLDGVHAEAEDVEQAEPALLAACHPATSPDHRHARPGGCACEGAEQLRP